jgi:hypothetical protein
MMLSSWGDVRTAQHQPDRPTQPGAPRIDRSLLHRHRQRPSNTAPGIPDFGTIAPPTPDLIHVSDSVQSANRHHSGALTGRRNLRTSNQLARERTGGDTRLVDHLSAADRDVVAIDALDLKRRLVCDCLFF